MRITLYNTVKVESVIILLKFTTNEQIWQNSVNFGPKCSPEIEKVPQTEFAVFAAFRDSGCGS